MIMGNKDKTYSQEQNDFLSQIPESNIDWAAQQFMQHFSGDEFLQLQNTFSKMDEALYKGWGKEMTFEELKEAVERVEDISNK